MSTPTFKSASAVEEGQRLPADDQVGPLDAALDALCLQPYIADFYAKCSGPTVLDNKGNRILPNVKVLNVMDNFSAEDGPDGSSWSGKMDALRKKYPYWPDDVKVAMPTNMTFRDMCKAKLRIIDIKVKQFIRRRSGDSATPGADNHEERWTGTLPEFNAKYPMLYKLLGDRTNANKSDAADVDFVCTQKRKYDDPDYKRKMALLQLGEDLWMFPGGINAYEAVFKVVYPDWAIEIDGAPMVNTRKRLDGESPSDVKKRLNHAFEQNRRAKMMHYCEITGITDPLKRAEVTYSEVRQWQDRRIAEEKARSADRLQVAADKIAQFSATA